MFEKLQKDFLAAMFNEKKAREALFCKTEESAYLLLNGSFFVKIPLEECFVKPSKICRNIRPETLEKIENTENTEKLTYTGITKELNDKNKVAILTTDDGREVWLNEKFIKYFTDNKLIIPISFYKTAGDAGRTPVKVYTGDLLIGVILPVYQHD